MKKPYSIKINPELLKEAQDFAAKNFRSVTSLIEISLKEYLEKAKRAKKK